jgi:hypothetical protein
MSRCSKSFFTFPLFLGITNIRSWSDSKSMQFVPAAFSTQLLDYHQLGESCGVAARIGPFHRFPLSNL